MINEKGRSLIEVVIFGPLVVLMGLGIVGWIMNLVRVFSVDDTFWLVMRLVGLVLPIIGAVIGYIPN